MRTCNKMRVIHLFPNEVKFFKGAVDFFEPLNWSEKWVIRCDPEFLPAFKAIQPEGDISLFESPPPSLRGVDGIIVHYLDLEMAHWILELPAHVPVYIQTWGGDTAPLLDSGWLYGSQTRSYYYEQSAFRFLPLFAGYSLYESKRKWTDRQWHHTLRAAIERAQFTSFLLGSTERNAISPDRPVDKEFRITYVKGAMTPPINPGSRNHVLLGNSATPTNQHWEALLTLKASDFEPASILIPLNYGDMEYANWISTKARALFGSTVSCLRDFLPLNEYQQQISECGMVIMNQTRQQALGNVFWALNSGKRVFLNPNGFNFQYLTAKDVICEPLSTGQLKATAASPNDIRASAQTPFERDFGTTTESKQIFFESLFA